MPGPRRRGKRRTKQSGLTAYAILAGVFLAVVGIGVTLYVSRGPEFDGVTLCPAEPPSTTVLVVDVTDPMNAPQRQDLVNQLERLKNSLERHGRLVVYKVDATSDQLLLPVIERCNPGTAADVSELNANPTRIQALWDEQFSQPLDQAFRSLMTASGADTSPILESIQSASLTELQRRVAVGKPRRLIIVSDLLQNTAALSFYGTLPEPSQVLSSAAFRSGSTDLRGVNVQLWMLQRPDSMDTQPRALPDLWDRLISAQNGIVERVYVVSG